MEKVKEKFKGIGALIVTPFDDDYELDLQGMKGNIDYIIENGIDATRGFLIANGSTGECYAMNMEERREVIRKVVEFADGRIPVMAGCNDTNVFNVIELANYSKEVGAEAVMIIQPYYVPFNDRQNYSFFKFINDRIDLPIMIYNNPVVASRSDMSVNLLRRLSKLDKIFSLKEMTTDIKRFFHAQTLTEDMVVFAGDSVFQPFGKMANMDGFITLLANFFPRLHVDLWEALKAEDCEKAGKLHKQELKLQDWWWSGNIEQAFGEVVCTKKAMDLMGLVGGKVRPPLLPLEKEQIKGLREVLKEMGADLREEKV